MHIIQMPSGTTESGQAPRISVRRIVVPLDGTPYSERALPTAVTLARAWNAELILVRADVSRLSEAVRRSHPLRRQERETAHSASLYLARMEHEVRARGARVSSRLPVGAAAEAILTAATECHADLVVIATHAGGGFSGSSQMSVARELMRHADMPTLLLAYGTHSPFDRQDCPGLTLVAPLDSAAAGTVALPYASLLARTFAGQVLLLGGASSPAAPGVAPLRPPVAAARAEAILNLERERAHVESAHVPVWTAVVDGDLYEEAAALAGAGADVIVLTAQSGAERREPAVETALRLVRRSRMPILVVPQRRHLRVVTEATEATEATAEGDGVPADGRRNAVGEDEEETHA